MNTAAIYRQYQTYVCSDKSGWALDGCSDSALMAQAKQPGLHLEMCINRFDSGITLSRMRGGGTGAFPTEIHNFSHNCALFVMVSGQNRLQMGGREYRPSAGEIWLVRGELADVSETLLPDNGGMCALHLDFSLEKLRRWHDEGLLDERLFSPQTIGRFALQRLAQNAAALTAASRKQRHSEATTAVLLTAFFSLGIVISLRIGDMSGQLESLMFGRLLDITPSRMTVSALVLVVAAALLALTWRAQVAVAFDREAARVSGIPVNWIDIAFNAALGAIVVAASTAVGVLLVVGYLIVPGAFGRLLAAGPRSMVLLAAACALVGGWGGFGVSLLRTARPLSPQACVALGVLVCFVAALPMREIRARRARSTGPARETARETIAAGGGDAS